MQGEINNSVTSIDLRGNNIGAGGAACLGEALKINKSVTSIKLYGNKIGAEDMDRIRQSLS